MTHTPPSKETELDPIIKRLAIQTHEIAKEAGKEWSSENCYNHLHPRWLAGRSLRDLTIDAADAASDPNLLKEHILASHDHRLAKWFKAIPSQGTGTGPTPPAYQPATKCRDCGHLSHICACDICECGALRQQPHAADCGVRV